MGFITAAEKKRGEKSSLFKAVNLGAGGAHGDGAAAPRPPRDAQSDQLR